MFFFSPLPMTLNPVPCPNTGKTLRIGYALLQGSSFNLEGLSAVECMHEVHPFAYLCYCFRLCIAVCAPQQE